MQLEGTIYDRENRIEYIELKGTCDSQAWHSWLELLRTPTSPTFIIQLVDNGTWISESDFRQCFLQS